MTVYHYPVLSSYDFGIVRSPGPGLGNLLFPISRALIGRERHGGNFVYPTFRQIKVGPILRREKDLRTYGGIMRERIELEWRVWLAAKKAYRIREANYDGSQDGVTVRYAGLGRHFHDINEYRTLISSWMSANAHFEGYVREGYDIGLHVRLGDFTTTPRTASGASTRSSVEWYQSALEMATSLLGLAKPKILLFTDGNPKNLIATLSHEDIVADPSKNAVTAIANLSNARLIITSRSTFSMWAAFIGNKPAIWDANFDLTKYFPLRHGLDYVN